MGVPAATMHDGSPLQSARPEGENAIARPRQTGDEAAALVVRRRGEELLQDDVLEAAPGPRELGMHLDMRRYVDRHGRRHAANQVGTGQEGQIGSANV